MKATEKAIRRPRSAFTALFTKLPARRSPGWNYLRDPFLPAAPFMAYGTFRNCPRQNHGMAGNREAGDHVNSNINSESEQDQRKIFKHQK